MFFKKKIQKNNYLSLYNFFCCTSLYTLFLISYCNPFSNRNDVENFLKVQTPGITIQGESIPILTLENQRIALQSMVTEQSYKSIKRQVNNLRKRGVSQSLFTNLIAAMADATGKQAIVALTNLVSAEPSLVQAIVDIIAILTGNTAQQGVILGHPSTWAILASTPIKPTQESNISYTGTLLHYAALYDVFANNKNGFYTSNPLPNVSSALMNTSWQNFIPANLTSSSGAQLFEKIITNAGFSSTSNNLTTYTKAISLPDQWKNTAVHYATLSSDPQTLVVKSILKNLTLPVTALTDKDTTKTLDILQKNTVQILTFANQWKYTPLHLAAMNSSLDMIFPLIVSLAPDQVLKVLTMKDQWGNSPLHYGGLMHLADTSFNNQGGGSIGALMAATTPALTILQQSALLLSLQAAIEPISANLSAVLNTTTNYPEYFSDSSINLNSLTALRLGLINLSKAIEIADSHDNRSPYVQVAGLVLQSHIQQSPFRSSLKELDRLVSAKLTTPNEILDTEIAASINSLTSTQMMNEISNLTFALELYFPQTPPAAITQTAFAPAILQKNAQGVSPMDYVNMALSNGSGAVPTQYFYPGSISHLFKLVPTPLYEINSIIFPSLHPGA